MTAYVALALGTALCAGSSPATSTTSEVAPEAIACPSFAELKQRLDVKIAEILALKPGLPLKDFAGKYAFRALDFWNDVKDGRDTVFVVAVSDGSAEISDKLVCLFDRNDLLRSCTHECCRYTTRTITEGQYNSLAVGATRQDVERQLCSPSDAEVDRKNGARVSMYYHIDLPVDHHDEGQTVLLVFENGRLVSKGMSPYY